MAQLSENELQRIIARDKPGYRVLKRDAGPKADAVEDRGGQSSTRRVTDLADLRTQYLGTPEGAAQAADEAPAPDDADDEIVVISPEQAADDPWRPGPGPKSVVVSGKERRVVAEQG
jgi:hypothetical protein